MLLYAHCVKDYDSHSFASNFFYEFRDLSLLCESTGNNFVATTNIDVEGEPDTSLPAFPAIQVGFYAGNLYIIDKDFNVRHWIYTNVLNHNREKIFVPCFLKEIG